MIHDIKLNDPILTIWNGPTNVKSYLELYNREINYHVNYNLQLVEMTGESIGRDSSATSGYIIKYHAVRTQNAPYIIETRDYTTTVNLNVDYLTCNLTNTIDLTIRLAPSNESKVPWDPVPNCPVLF